MCPPVTCRSRLHTSCVSSVRKSRSRLVRAVTTDADSSQALFGRSRPPSSLRATEPVSTYADSSGTTGLIGPCTVSNQFVPTNWSSSM